ncbi:MAG: YggS family pyridoxal phosphate-dependent enzyme [Magnetococcales bacterium]|nr:YggS family pyridoxal phosphate-dependent enzyme [Magnetococcales bacterium]MBF0437903.1 YggS family pyridoxal phosphate-dependent enzyme [Magnetococcales bacterium]
MISTNLTRIRAEIEAACQRVGRDPASVRLVVVSKTRTVEEIREVVAGGEMLFGENRVQEAQGKIPLVNHPAVQWHLIGPLQRNKVKIAVEMFQMIHSLDSLELAEEVSKRALLVRPMPVLLQVNVGREPQKTGIMAEEAVGLVRKLALLPGIILQGLMTIPPMTDRAEEARPWFRSLARLKEEILAEQIDGIGMQELSMGMSHDYAVAVEEGATLVRIGSAVFG